MDSTVSIRDAYYQEGVVEAGKGKNASYSIAWILAAIFILAILFWVFNRASCNHNDMSNRTADHNCQTRERLGILEGQMMSVGTVLGQLVPQVNELGRVATGTSVGLNQWVACTNDKLGVINHDIYKLDNAVFVSRCGDDTCGGRHRCGDGGRRFDQRQVYTTPVVNEVIVSESCRN